MRLQRTVRMTAQIAAASPVAVVHAQNLANVTTIAQNVLTALQSISVVMVSIALIWVGYKMIFQNARWSEVANIVIGALFIGSASVIASWLLGRSA